MSLPAINATVQDPGANSYVSQAQAQAYFDLQFGPGAAAWNSSDPSAPNGDQCKALLLAAKHLSMLRYIGTRYNPAQVLDFPRQYPFQGLDPQSPWNMGIAIPQAVQDAQCEEAAAILQNALSPGSMPGANVTRYGVGNLTETYSAGSVVDDTALESPKAWRLLKGWICLTGTDQGGWADPGIVINSLGYNPMT